MSISSGRSTTSNNLGIQDSRISQKKIGIVYDVILDENHPYAISTEYGSLVTGCILYRTKDNVITSTDKLPIAWPLDKNYKSLPVKNEEVEIYEISEKEFGYRRKVNDTNPSSSGNNGDLIRRRYSPVKDEKQNVKDYQETSATGIASTNFDLSRLFDGFGKYYQPQNALHKLKLYEGDTLIESRFGQSIRFSGYNNVNNIFSPTLILRNGESARSRKLGQFFTTEEDINRDGGVIVLSSDQYQLPFQPGTINDSGTSDFETKPESFANFPTKLIGDQILINSGRLIFSAKNAEMIFYSKKNYGFISDGGMSIDNKLGINVNVNDNINIVTNDRDVVMYTGNGSIFLGNTAPLEPLVKGQQLVDILSQLIDAIAAQTFLTPSGPTAEGPVNIADFGAIKSRLNDILSKLNQTS
jgi:hypothetical protein